MTTSTTNTLPLDSVSRDNISSSTVGHSVFSSSYSNQSTLYCPQSSPMLFSFPAGQQPIALAFGENIVYVADSATNSVEEFNLTGYPITNISVGEMPYVLAYNSASKTLFVGNFRSISTIVGNSTKSNLLSNVNFYPISLLYVPSPFNELFVGLATNSTVILNPDTGNIIKSINNTVVPFSIIYDPQDKLVYEKNYSSMIIINPSTNSVVNSFLGLGGVMTYDMQDNRIFIAGDTTNSGDVASFDPVNNRITVNVSTPGYSRDVEYNPLDHLVYVVNLYPGAISTYETNLTFVRTLTLTDQPISIGYDSLDNFLYAVFESHNYVGVFNSFSTSNLSGSTCTSTNPSMKLFSSTQSSSVSSTQIVFYIEIFYSGQWTGSYSYGPDGGSSTTVHWQGNSGFRNDTTVFEGNIYNGICVSAQVQKQDAGNGTLNVEIYSATFDLTLKNQSSAPYGIVRLNGCAIP